MTGRRPKVIIDDDIYRPTKAQKENRENSTPIYQSQNFIPPPSLNEKELEVWNWLVKIFRETINCAVTDCDVHLMELYCRAKVATDEADAAMKNETRAYIRVPNGNFDFNGKEKYTLKENPNIKKRKDNALLCLRFFDQLGLTPLARARAGVKGANAKREEDIFAGLLNRSDEKC